MPTDTIRLDDFNHDLPEKMPVSVIMEKIPSAHQWIDFTYQAVGVITAEFSNFHIKSGNFPKTTHWVYILHQ